MVLSDLPWQEGNKASCLQQGHLLVVVCSGHRTLAAGVTQGRLLVELVVCDCVVRRHDEHGPDSPCNQAQNRSLEET